MNTAVHAVALPLIGAFLLPVLWRAAGRVSTVLGPLILLTSTIILACQWNNFTSPSVIAIGGFAPPLGISFYLDEIALLFAAIAPLMALILWPGGSDEAAIRKQSLTLLLVAATAGLAMSGDLFNLYVFYELAAVASYGLAASKGTGAGYAASFRYLIISSVGSVFALLGVAIVYFNTGTLNLAHLASMSDALNNIEGLAAFILLAIGFGVKAELFPVNAWVPEVYAATTSRVSALLAGLVSKLAVLVILRFLLLVFPFDEAREILLILGTLGVITGELAAWRARDMARMLAWSSIGQLGLIFIAFSIPGEAGIIAGLAIALHHLVVKPALFLLAERWKGSLDSLTGAAAVSPLGGILFVLFALSLLGLPPLPGFWAKLLLLTGLMDSGVALASTVLAIVLVALVIEASYLARVISKMYSPKPSHNPPQRHSLLNLTTATAFAALLLVAVFNTNNIWQSLTDMARMTKVIPSYSTVTTSGKTLGYTSKPSIESSKEMNNG